MRVLLLALWATLFLLACDGRTTSALPHGRSDSGDTVDGGQNADVGPAKEDGGAGPDRALDASARRDTGGLPEDSGEEDAAAEDTGAEDAGEAEDAADAGLAVDAGVPGGDDGGLSLDTGVLGDAGLSDDAGYLDTGLLDAGLLDTGLLDAGGAADGSSRDGGSALDSGPRDASGGSDGGSADAAAPYDGGRPSDAGCAGPPGAADGGPLPVTRISFVSGSIDAVVDLTGLGQTDILSVVFDVEFDNQTGGSERICVSGASLTSLLIGGALPFDTDPWAFDLRQGRSTYRVANVPGSTPITDIAALAGVCGFPSQLVVDFSTGQQISAVVLPECLR